MDVGFFVPLASPKVLPFLRPFGSKRQAERGKTQINLVFLSLIRTFANCMKQVIVKDKDLSNAALEGMDEFLQVFIDALREAIGGEPTAETMQELNADQMTLLCWDTLHQEVMDGGFIQLIHNGYGPFIFKNPFAKALNKMWHMRDLSKMLYEVHTLWLENREALEKDCTDEEFMALFEQYPQFDDYDDMFVENEERWTKEIALYVDENVDRFAKIEN